MAPFSEREFHAWLARSVRGGGRLPLGDDAAALPAGGNRVLLLTTDAFAEGRHFLPRSPPMELGAALAAASLSDIAAKGGQPLALLLDLLLPPSTSRSWARSVVGGALSMIRRHGGMLVGGDTKSSGSRAIVGTVVAWGDRRCLAPRSGARPGDALVVTGRVGRGGRVARPLLEGRVPTMGELRALLDIEPRLREGRALAATAHAMLDTSDGLGDAVRLMSQASKVRVVVDAAALPLAPGLRAIPDGELRWRLAFYGGDYELCAAVPPASVPSLTARVARLGGSLTRVGTVERGRGAHLREHDRTRPMPRAGWDPFAPVPAVR